MVAIREFGFSPENKKKKCPPAMNVSYAFGEKALDVSEMNKMFREKADGTWKGFQSTPRKSPSRRSPRKTPQDVVILE